MLTKFLVLLLVIIVVRMLLVKLFGSQPRKVRSSRPGGASRSDKTIRGKMVKDPQCGMYVATDLAVPAKTGGETLFFCSQECRRTYLAKLREAQ